MNKKLILKILFFVLYAVPQLYAQSGIEPVKIERAGQSGWQFLKINGDPRQAAIGGSFMTTINANGNVVFGSPAILAYITNYDIQFNSMNWIGGISHNSAVIAKNFGSIGSVAISIVSLDYGDIPETIHLGLQGGATVPFVTGNTFTASDLATGISYAKKITDRLSLGGTMRYLSEKIADTGMTSWSMDFSTIYYTGLKSLRMSIVSRNFGPDAHLVGFSEELKSEPVDIQMPYASHIGLAVDIIEQTEGPHLWTMMLEGKVPSDGPEKIHIGTEYLYQNMIALRGGYRFNYDEEGLTLGFGVNFLLESYEGTVNYAYLDFGALRSVHVFSFGSAF